MAIIMHGQAQGQGQGRGQGQSQGQQHHPSDLARKWALVANAAGIQGFADARPEGMLPTPRAVVFQDNDAKLLRFLGPGNGQGPAVLLVPSMINRWYVLDLRRGASLIEHLVAAGLDVFCIDWGETRDEDRHLDWNGVIARLLRMWRAARVMAGQDRLGVLGYCMGATLASIGAALQPDWLNSLVNLAGPIDFSHAGPLGRMTDARWFDASAVAAAGNVAPAQMQSGFTALRPTLQVGKWVGLADRFADDIAVEAFAAMELWANDNLAFPAAAYATYIGELYQQNALVAGKHAAMGQRIDLGRIHCPTLVVTASRDTICPPAAANALLDAVGSAEKRALQVPGGHVGAVIGSRASRVLYPQIADWFRQNGQPQRQVQAQAQTQA